MDIILDISIEALSATADRLGMLDAFSPADSKLLRLCELNDQLPSGMLAWYSRAEPLGFDIARPTDNLPFRCLQDFDGALRVPVAQKPGVEIGWDCKSTNDRHQNGLVPSPSIRKDQLLAKHDHRGGIVFCS
jgi:hypothetical protein